MTTTQDQENEMPPGTPGEKSKAIVDRVKTEAKAAQARIKVEEKARLKAEKALAEAQEDLAAVQAELESARQARALAEKRLDDCQRETTSLRAEIDSERQARSKAEQALMEAQKAVETATEPVEPPEPSHEPFEERKPAEPSLPAQLTIRDVSIFPKGYPQRTPITFQPDEVVVVETQFQIHGPGAQPLVARKYPYEIMVYLTEVRNHTSALLTSFHSKLIKETFEYKTQMQALRLSPGVYRPLIVVVIYAPARLSAQWKGPFLQVGEIQSIADPRTSLNESTPV